MGGGRGWIEQGNVSLPLWQGYRMWKVRALIRPVGHLLPFASERAKALSDYRLLPCSGLARVWEKVPEGG
jgi:hypothetical protein